MNHLTHRTSYRLGVAILFGLIGFGLNSFNIQLFESPAFKLSVLIGLFFPLLISMAWGWRYGLLSAMAGGCQTMWWLWANDGWGVLYAVPIFTLWIVWHGWWADRRTDPYPWHETPFLVEIPFRILMELGFFTLFPWLVSFNPPPWNQEIIWNLVPVSWMITSATKHTLTAYILLLAAYVVLNLGPVRKMFGLPPKFAQHDTHIIYAGALLLGLFLWVAEASFHYLFNKELNQTFLDIAILHVPPHDAFMRFLYIFLAIAGAAALVPLVRRRARLQQRFDHQNRILEAIRNITKIITNEKDRQTLLQSTCDSLIATQGYTLAWIVLLDASGHHITHAWATTQNDLDITIDHLQAKEITSCARRALSTPEIVTVADPARECPECPFTHSNKGWGCISRQLSHENSVHGFITVSLPGHLLHDPQEHRLFREITDDIAYALHGLIAEKALRASQEEIRSIFKSAPVGIGLINNRVIKRVNAHFCTMVGYTEEELLEQRTAMLHLSPEIAEKVGNELAGQIHKQGTSTIETQLQCKGGSIIDVILNATPLDMAKLSKGITVSALDITDRKNAENALKESEKKLSTTLHSIGDAVISTDRQGNVTNMNPIAEQLTGWSKKHAQGKPLSETFHILNALTREPAESPAAKVIRLGKIVGLANHTILIAKDGTERQIADSAAPIWETHDTITGIVLVFRDVTEEYRMQNQLQKAQKLKSIGTLAGGIAHDFNNILMGIFGNIELAKIKLSPEHPAYSFIERAEKSLDRATHLTNQLRTFSKGGMPILQNISLGKILQEIAAFDLSGSKVKPVFNIADNLWLANADKGQVQQVLSNLTINAKQAMPSGGTLHYTLKNKEIGPDNPVDIAPGKYIEISVQDEGTGIDQKYIDQIFDPYFTTKQMGSGLGLPTAYSIITRHGGHISVSSLPGKGTTFTLYLPASEAPATKNLEAPIRPQKTTGQQARILVMDDEKMIHDVMSAMLKGLGFMADTAFDGKEALAMYKQAMNQGTPFDVVIMDLTIPGGMGGQEAIEKLLLMDPNAKAIVASGYTDDPIMSHFADYGFKGMATKPYTMEELRQTLHHVLET